MSQRKDSIIINRKREEERCINGLLSIKANQLCEERSRLEQATNLKIKKNQIMNRFEELRSLEEDKLAVRKESLRQLLEKEQQQFQQELVSKEETTDERIERMKARVAELKESREIKRKAFAQEKLLERWRNECDELRLIDWQTSEKALTDARKMQLQEQAEIKKELALENQKYHELWERDRLKKVEREKQDMLAQQKLNAEMVAMLDDQMKLIRQHELEEARLRQEEGVLLQQQNELQILQEKRNQESKAQAQKQRRLELDAFNQQNLLARSLEVQKALDLDMEIVQRLLQADKLEREQQGKQKEELKMEMALYRENLANFKKHEINREKEIERLYREEEDRDWRKKIAKWRKDQDARDKLMNEVIAGRKEQIRYAMEQNKLAQQELLKYREAMMAQIELSAAEQEKKKLERISKDKAYQATLVQQMKELDIRKEKEIEELEAEHLAELKTRKEFEALLEKEKARMIQQGTYRPRKFIPAFGLK